MLWILTEHVDKPQNLTARLLESKANNTRGSVELHWDPPKAPNGAVVSYMIIYERQEENAVKERKCITAQDYRNQSSFVVPNLNEGKYSFVIRANSLAGEGDLSNYEYVVVPVNNLHFTSTIN